MDAGQGKQIHVMDPRGGSGCTASLGRLRVLLTLIVTVIGSVMPHAAERAHASPVDLFGYGARGGAMASAVASSVRGPAAIYYNPASLAFERYPSVAFGYQNASFDLSIDGQAHPARRAPALSLGFGVPLPLGGVLAERISLGLAFVFPQSAVLIADIPRPGDPHFVLVENRAQAVSLQGALGIRLADYLSMGVGFLALAELDGAIAVSPDDSGRLGATVGSELVASFALVCGVLARPTPWLSLALTYRGESAATFSYPIDADLGEDFPLPVPPLEIRGTAQFDPAKVSVDLSVKPLSWLLISAAVAWKRWSTFPNPIVYTAVPDDVPLQPPPAFEDIVLGRFGVEATIDLGKQWLLSPRLGVAFEPSPVPEQQGLHNYLDSDRLQLAFGLGLAWSGLRLDFMAQWHLMASRTSVKDADLLARQGVELEDAMAYPSVEHEGAIMVWGLELGLELGR